MSFREIMGQARAKQMLQSGLQNGMLSHAYLFSGPTGSGRKQTAIAFAKAILCKESVADACGTCIECRKVEHGNHPDLHRIEPDGSSIKIEQIRELQKEFGYRAGAGDKKIYIIDQADKMTVQAANSLLKFLEEPGAGVTAVLITENAQAILPTIRSRVQLVPFTAMAPWDMVPILTEEGQPEHLARAAAHIAAGLDAARQIIQLNWFAEIRNVVIQLGRVSASHRAAAILTVQQKVAKTDLMDHLDTMFDLFVLWFKDMISVQSGRKELLVYMDESDWLMKQAYSKEPAFWIERMERALEMKKRLRFHANPQLILEQYLSELQGG